MGLDVVAVVGLVVLAAHRSGNGESEMYQRAVWHHHLANSIDYKELHGRWAGEPHPARKPESGC